MDLIGKKFGRLTPIRKLVMKHRSHYECKCECGNEIIVICKNLKNGNTKSCGCLRNDQCFVTGIQNLAHGHAKQNKITQVYRAYYAMRTRCYNKNYHNYERYGGRGIKVCQRWLDSFEAFLADMGEPLNGDYSLDRIDNNGDYEPSNCKWSIQSDQLKNRTFY